MCALNKIKSHVKQKQFPEAILSDFGSSLSIYNVCSFVISTEQYEVVTRGLDTTFACCSK